MKIERELYQRISLITGVDYFGVVVNEDEFYFEEETIKKIIKDLLWERDGLEERLTDELHNSKVQLKINN